MSTLKLRNQEYTSTRRLWTMSRDKKHKLPSLLMTYLRSFKNQNGVTMFPAAKMEQDRHCRCHFRHSCITENLSFLNCIKLKDTTSHQPFSKQHQLAAATCNHVVSKFPPPFHNYVIIVSKAQPTLASQAPLLLVSSNCHSWQTIYVIKCDLAVFDFISFLHFVVWQNTIQVLSWICASPAAVLTKPK